MKPPDVYDNPLEDPRYWAAHEQIEYVVERRPKSWVWRRWQVRNKGATSEFSAIFAGTRNQCLRIQLHLHQAARNGAWVALTHKCC